MTKPQREDMERRMSEAAALPPNDGRRLAMLREVAEAGDWAERAWVELAGDDERLRLELLHVEVPAGLERRLSDLAAEEEPLTRRAGAMLLPWRRWMAVAAAVLLGAAVYMGTLAWPRADAIDGFEQRLVTLGALAADHHRVDHALSIETADRAEVDAALAGRFGWEVRLPDLGPEYRLLGATVCTLGGHEVVCTRWERGGRIHTLYQFCAPDYKLPPSFEKRDLDGAPGDLWVSGTNTRVTFWSERGCTYALVADGAGDPA